MTTLVEKRIAAGSSWHFASQMVDREISGEKTDPQSFRLSLAPIKAANDRLWWSQSKAQVREPRFSRVGAKHVL